MRAFSTATGDRATCVAGGGATGALPNKCYLKMISFAIYPRQKVVVCRLGASVCRVWSHGAMGPFLLLVFTARCVAALQRIQLARYNPSAVSSFRVLLPTPAAAERPRAGTPPPRAPRGYTPHLDYSYDHDFANDYDVVTAEPEITVIQPLLDFDRLVAAFNNRVNNDRDIRNDDAGVDRDTAIGNHQHDDSVERVTTDGLASHDPSLIKVDVYTINVPKNRDKNERNPKLDNLAYRWFEINLNEDLKRSPDDRKQHDHEDNGRQCSRHSSALETRPGSVDGAFSDIPSSEFTLDSEHRSVKKELAGRGSWLDAMCQSMAESDHPAPEECGLCCQLRGRLTALAAPAPPPARRDWQVLNRHHDDRSVYWFYNQS